MPRRTKTAPPPRDEFTWQVWRFPTRLHAEFKKVCQQNQRPMRNVVMSLVARYIDTEG